MVKKAEIMINLLRKPRKNPMLSAYAKIFGQFDFYATPMGPPGTKKLHMKNQHKGKHGTNMEYPDVTSVWNDKI